jgi:hypothetical protein
MLDHVTLTQLAVQHALAAAVSLLLVASLAARPAWPAAHTCVAGELVSLQVAVVATAGGCK